MMAIENNQTILFFDGVCNLCNALVDFVIRWDKKGKIKMASLQGSTAAQILPEQYTRVLNTVVFYKNGKFYTKTNAVIHALLTINSLLAPLAIFLVIPSFVRDPFYNLVARYRYNWFGQKETCRLPSEHEKQYFLP